MAIPSSIGKQRRVLLRLNSASWMSVLYIATAAQTAKRRVSFCVNSSLSRLRQIVSFAINRTPIIRLQRPNDVVKMNAPRRSLNRQWIRAIAQLQYRDQKLSWE